jgi:hypothetical protein
MAKSACSPLLGMRVTSWANQSKASNIKPKHEYQLREEQAVYGDSKTGKDISPLFKPPCKRPSATRDQHAPDPLLVFAV